ncbi:MAG: winged helix-turn-helix domain-containing protein [Phaeodactylibacter sp.]|uniref:winged helix-turn-helix domain-containing protein n=1 Tax=Phaeodactylibacter sp. TaxID=1940289 RepID=UPI0032EF67B6
MSAKYWILILGLAPALFCRASGTDAAFLQEDSHIAVTLRAIGHELLLSVGDSTSRVLPVQQVGNRYKVPFETAFPLEPTHLTTLVEKVTAGRAFPSDYIVEVEACNALEIVYAYEIRDEANSNLIPCQGRALPKDCYNLVFTFPEDRMEVATGGSAPLANYYKYAALAFIFFLLAGTVFYLSKRRPKAPLGTADHRTLGSFRFSPTAMKLSIDGQVTSLTAKEAELLALLHDHANETLERDTLLRTIWGNEDSYVGRTLDVFVSRLRKKLEGDPDVKIANVRGVGYKLVLVSQ